jgi:RNA polymerase sigma factor (sigma-70 family)
VDLRKLIEQCKNNDRKAQFELYDREYKALMQTAFRYHSNEEDAAEVVNLAFFKILTNLDKFNPEYSFSGWAKRVLTNTIIDEFRKNKKFNDQISVEDSAIDVFVDQNSVELALEIEEVNVILSQLSDNERLVFNLYEIEGYSHKEIAQQLDVSERSSKRYLAKAKLTLKDIVSRTLTPDRKAI